MRVGLRFLLEAAMIFSIAEISAFTQYKFPKRTAKNLISFADLHGDYRATIDAFTKANVIERVHSNNGYSKESYSPHPHDYRWIAEPDTVVVQLGDIVDRWNNAREIYDLLFHLQDQAEQASNGCELILILGNHEAGRMEGAPEAREWFANNYAGGNETSWIKNEPARLQPPFYPTRQLVDPLDTEGKRKSPLDERASLGGLDPTTMSITEERLPPERIRQNKLAWENAWAPGQWLRLEIERRFRVFAVVNGILYVHANLTWAHVHTLFSRVGSDARKAIEASISKVDAPFETYNDVVQKILAANSHLSSERMQKMLDLLEETIGQSDAADELNALTTLEELIEKNVNALEREKTKKAQNAIPKYENAIEGLRKRREQMIRGRLESKGRRAGVVTGTAGNGRVVAGSTASTAEGARADAYEAASKIRRDELRSFIIKKKEDTRKTLGEKQEERKVKEDLRDLLFELYWHKVKETIKTEQTPNRPKQPTPENPSPGPTDETLFTGVDSPFWSRPQKNEQATCRDLQEDPSIITEKDVVSGKNIFSKLAIYNETIIVGHTIQSNGLVTPMCGGKLLVTDTAMSEGYRKAFPYGSDLAGIEYVRKGTVSAITGSGQVEAPKVEVPAENAEGAPAYEAEEDPAGEAPAALERTSSESSGSTLRMEGTNHDENDDDHVQRGSLSDDILNAFYRDGYTHIKDLQESVVPIIAVALDTPFLTTARLTTENLNRYEDSLATAMDPSSSFSRRSTTIRRAVDGENEGSADEQLLENTQHPDFEDTLEPPSSQPRGTEFTPIIFDSPVREEQSPLLDPFPEEFPKEFPKELGLGLGPTNVINESFNEGKPRENVLFLEMMAKKDNADSSIVTGDDEDTEYYRDHAGNLITLSQVSSSPEPYDNQVAYYEEVDMKMKREVDRRLNESPSTTAKRQTEAKRKRQSETAKRRRQSEMIDNSGPKRVSDNTSGPADAVSKQVMGVLKSRKGMEQQEEERTAPAADETKAAVPTAVEVQAAIPPLERKPRFYAIPEEQMRVQQQASPAKGTAQKGFLEVAKTEAQPMTNEVSDKATKAEDNKKPVIERAKAEVGKAKAKAKALTTVAANAGAKAKAKAESTRAKGKGKEKAEAKGKGNVTTTSSKAKAKAETTPEEATGKRAKTNVTAKGKLMTGEAKAVAIPPLKRPRRFYGTEDPNDPIEAFSQDEGEIPSSLSPRGAPTSSLAVPAGGPLSSTGVLLLAPAAYVQRSLSDFMPDIKSGRKYPARTS